MITEKRILEGESGAFVGFDVTGDTVMLKSYTCKKKIFGMRNQIAALLGLSSPQIIEMEKPHTIPGGLRVSFFIHLNHITSREVDYKKLFNLRGPWIRCLRSQTFPLLRQNPRIV